jgi:hypothetical protein
MFDMPGLDDNPKGAALIFFVTEASNHACELFEPFLDPKK